MQAIKTITTYPFKLLWQLLVLFATPFTYIWALFQWRTELPLYQHDPVTDEMKILAKRNMTPLEKAEYCLDKGIIPAPRWIKSRQEKVQWVLRSKPSSFWAE